MQDVLLIYSRKEDKQRIGFTNRENYRKGRRELPNIPNALKDHGGQNRMGF
jgi:hypothetical protein